MPRAAHHNPPDSMVLLGRALRDLRESRGLKQIEVAGAAGTTESRVSETEQARNDPQWSTVARLLDAMGATVEDLAVAYERAREDSG